MKEAVGMGHLSLKRLTAGGIEGGRLWRRASLYMGLSWATWSGLLYRRL